jgi:hypothetical protein
MWVSPSRLGLQAQAWLTVGRGLSAEPRSFSNDELKLHAPHLFIMYQVGLEGGLHLVVVTDCWAQIGFYASNMANDWKRLILQRWPALYPQLYSVEIADAR